jgi:hypothetical protein
MKRILKNLAVILFACVVSAIYLKWWDNDAVVLPLILGDIRGRLTGAFRNAVARRAPQRPVGADMKIRWTWNKALFAIWAVWTVAALLFGVWLDWTNSQSARTIIRVTEKPVLIQPVVRCIMHMDGTVDHCE